MKRPWFRIHLSTALVLMFVAGGLIWVNSLPRYRRLFDSPLPHNLEERGWPLVFYSKFNVMIDDPHFMESARTAKIDETPLAIDFVVSLTIIFLTGVIAETIYRRKNHIALPSQPSNT